MGYRRRKMNLFEAVKSGRPFKRKVWDEYYSNNCASCYSLYREDIHATDYEIVQLTEKSVTITKKQLLVAISEARKQKYANDRIVSYVLPEEGISSLLPIIFKELGLDD